MDRQEEAYCKNCKANHTHTIHEEPRNGGSWYMCNSCDIINQGFCEGVRDDDDYDDDDDDDF